MPGLARGRRGIGGDATGLADNVPRGAATCDDDGELHAKESKGKARGSNTTIHKNNLLLTIYTNL